MDYLKYERNDPNILNMDFNKFHNLKLLLDDSSIRGMFLEVLPKEIFSTETYNLMEMEGYQVNMSPGKWLLRYLGNRGGRVSDLIYWFQEINLERALIYLKEEEPLQIIEQPESNININEGENFCITCRASGYPHPEYQWYKDDEELILEREQVLSIPFAKVEVCGIYMCKVSKRNSNSSVSLLFSDTATVVVWCKSSNLISFSRQNSVKSKSNSIRADMQNIQTKPNESNEQNILSKKCPELEKIFILKQPRSYGVVAQGSILWFQCIAKASHPVSYQWYRNGQLLDEQTSTKLLVDELYPDQASGNRKFRFFCKVYNEYDEVISDFATVELSESDNKTKYVAEEKIAFLIANDKYEAYVDNLVTPAVDVVDLSKLLNSINFKVVAFRNLNLRDMKSAFHAFCKLLRAGSYAVLFFAGHGFECYGQTYLQPIDCSENLIPEESMCTEYILQQMQETRPALIVLLIDACRKRPPELGNTQIERYDASMGNNTVYGYATSFLNGAYESSERNSYFVKHLKKYIMHDKSIQEIIFQVQRDFDSEPLTRNIQHPVIESSLCATRKLCDELRNPLDITINQAHCWFYKERNLIEKQTQIINEFNCCFIIEVKDHMDVYLNGIDINLYIFVKETANLHKLHKNGLLVVLNIPDLKVRKGIHLQNTPFKLGVRNLILKEEFFELQRLQNAEIKAQLLLKIGQNLIPIDFFFTIEKIKSINIFF